MVMVERSHYHSPVFDSQSRKGSFFFFSFLPSHFGRQLLVLSVFVVNKLRLLVSHYSISTIF